MRRLAFLVLALAPIAALAKPMFYRPRETVDSEAQATAATAKLGAAIRARNTAQIGQVLGAQFTNNGMWFPDAACTKRFEVSGEVKGADVAVFARCLAGLKLQISTRKPAQRDGAVLTADPGIEIDLAFRGETLRWIGLPTQGGADRAVPMLTAQALEALRTQGSTVLDAKVGQTLELDRVSHGGNMALAWVKVCLDPQGAVAKATSLQASSPEAASTFLAAIADWKFRPFEVRGKPTAACAASLLVYPASKAPLVEQYPSTLAPPAPITTSFDFDDDELEIMGALGGIGVGPPPPPSPPPPPTTSVPPALLEKLRVAGNRAIVPDPATKGTMVQSGRTRVAPMMAMCLDDKGNVSSVAQLKSSGFPAYDRKIIAEMRQWVFKPYQQNGRAAPVCSTITIPYDATKPSP